MVNAFHGFLHDMHCVMIVFDEEDEMFKTFVVGFPVSRYVFISIALSDNWSCCDGPS